MATSPAFLRDGALRAAALQPSASYIVLRSAPTAGTVRIDHIGVMRRPGDPTMTLPTPRPPSQPLPAGAAGGLLCFDALDRGAPALVFPCGRDGQVLLDTLTERQRNDYFFARAAMGWRFARPRVEALS